MKTTLYIVVMTIVFLFQFIFQYLIKIKTKKIGTIKSFNYITKKYKLNMDEKRAKKLALILICVNTLILALPIGLIIYTNINAYILCAISFVIFIVGILFLYNCVGKYLKKKGW